MKKVIILTLSVILVFSIGYFAVTGREKVNTKSLGDKEVYVRALNDSIVKSEGDLGSNKIMQAYSNLHKKAEDFTDNDLLVIVKSDEFDSLTKSAMIQLSDKINKGEGINDSEKFYELIPQKSIDTAVRINLLQTLDMSSKENKAVLEDIVKSEDGAIVVRSLMKLQKEDAKSALRVSNEIIKNNKKHNEDALRAAVMTKGEYLQDLKLAKSEKNVNSEKEEYIDFCISTFEAAQSNVLKDATVFSLMNMQDFEAVKAVIEHPEIEALLKKTCVTRNYQTFVDVINNDPSKDDIDFIITALYMAPLSDMADIIETKVATNPEFDSERLRNLITLMRKNEVSADKKIAEKTPDLTWVS